MERLAVRKWPVWEMHSTVQKYKARYSFFKVCTVVPLFILSYLRATVSHIIIEKKAFVGIMSSYYCLYYLQYSEQTMLLKKIYKPCAIFVFQKQNWDVTCVSLILVRSIRPTLLGFSFISLTVCSSRWAEADGCLQTWDLWGRLMCLPCLPLSESPELKPASFSVLRSQKQCKLFCVLDLLAVLM